MTTQLASPSHTRAFRVGARSVAAALFSLASLFAQGATTDQFTSSGTGVQVSGVLHDNCRSGSMFLNSSAGATHGPTNSPPTQQSAFAFVVVFGFNSCTNAFFSTAGFSAVNIQFAAQDGNGTQVPKSVTVSGHVPSFDGADTISFQVTLNAVGLPFQDSITEQLTVPISSTNSVSVNRHSDGNSSSATGSVSVSTQILGPLPISTVFGSVQDNRAASVSITH